MKVKEIMTTGLLQICNPETKLQMAAKTMKKGDCGSLPVIDKNNKVIGMVTDRDICLSLANQQGETFFTTKCGRYNFFQTFTVEADDDLTSALREMRTNKIGRLPVIDKEGELKGVLSVHDLLSKSMAGEVELGFISADVETIARTVKVLADSYSFHLHAISENND